MQQPSVLETAAAVVQARNRIRSHIYETPLVPSRTDYSIDEGGTKVLFKAENFQLTGSFKIRGAMAKMSVPKLDNAAAAQSRLITSSSGNHGIGAACAAKALGKDLTVVLPENAVPAKIAKIKSFGAKIILHGSETGLAEQYGQELAASGDYSYISPYNDADIVAGQGTIGLEILEQCNGKVDNIFIAMGGGGLISGIGSVLQAFCPNAKAYGVSAVNSKALAESMKAGKVVETEHLKTLADGVSGGMDIDSITLPLAIEVTHRVIECNEDDITAALKDLAFKENMIVEGAAALAYAGYKKIADELVGETSVIVLCGANFDKDVIHKTIFS